MSGTYFSLERIDALPLRRFDLFVSSNEMFENLELIAKAETDKPEISFTLYPNQTEGETYIYSLPESAGISPAAFPPGKYNLFIKNNGNYIPVTSKVSVEKRFIKNNILLGIYSTQNGVKANVFALSSVDSNPYSVFDLDRFDIEKNKIYVSGRFAPIGTIVEEWGQASYILVLEGSENGTVFSFGLGIQDRPNESLPNSLRKTYFSNLGGKGITLFGIPCGKYSVKIAFSNNDVTTSSQVIGEIEVYTEENGTIPEISLLGSCIIRDAFNSRFISDWKNRSTIKSEAFQQTIISATGKPYKGISLDLSDLDNLARKYTENDLEKEFINNFVTQSNGWLLIDLFSDARFGVIDAGENQFITDNTWKIANSNSYKNLSQYSKISLSDNPSEYLEKFQEALLRLKNKISPDVSIAYVKINAASFSRDEYGRIDSKKNIADNLNSAFIQLEKILLDIFPNCIILDLTKYTVWGDKDHPWSSYAVHFEQDFYDGLDKELRNIFNKQRKVRILSGK